MTTQPDLFDLYFAPLPKPVRYPDAPGYKERGATSQAAAEAVADKASALELEVLEAVRRQPGTSAELAARLGADYYNVQPRVSQLRKKGQVRPSGVRRPGRTAQPAHVWEAVPQ